MGWNDARRRASYIETKQPIWEQRERSHKSSGQKITQSARLYFYSYNKASSEGGWVVRGGLRAEMLIIT